MTINLHKKILLMFLIIITPHVQACNSSRVGDPNWQYDATKNDPNFPEIQYWKEAGVEGGVPCKESIPKINTKYVNSDFQVKIDNTYNEIESSGLSYGYLLLKNGVHYIDNPIKLRSGVVIRGENQAQTQLIVRIKNNYNDGTRRVWAFDFENVINSGIENLTIKFEVKDNDGTEYQPLDRNNYDEPNFDTYWPFNNNMKVKRISPDFMNPIVDENLFVGFIRFSDGTKNSWAQDLNLIESGTHPIWISPDSSHITLRGNDIYRCYNKGVNGNCYYGINGDYNLITNERVRKIRHVAIQEGAEYNVVFKNDFEVDINFHNGDHGNNLIERNKIKLPYVHKWPTLSTGEQDKHLAPGINNIIYKNTTDHIREGYNVIPWYNKVYTLSDYSPAPNFDGVNSIQEAPLYGTFYPMVYE